MLTSKTIPNKAGIGLRSEHYREILEASPDVSWFEVHTENFFAEGGYTIEVMEKISSKYPISFHGVSLSLGSTDGLNKNYLKKLKAVIDRFKPGLVSEHLSWTSYEGIYTHDLLPLPYNKDALELLSGHISYVQEYLGRQILIENPSSYLTFKDSTISEDDFLNQLAHKTGCGILLDVNNVYVSSKNNSFDPHLYSIDPKYIKEIHLAGHTIIHNSKGDRMIIDTHDDFICSNVWSLYEETIKQTGPISTLIEWDNNLPPFAVLLEEAQRAQTIIDINKNAKTQRTTETIS